MKQVRSKLSYANVTATLALAAALGGGIAAAAGGGGAASSVTGGHLRGISSGQYDKVAKLKGVIAVEAICGTSGGGFINPVLKNLAGVNLEVMRTYSGNSTTEGLLEPGESRQYGGLGTGDHWAEFQVFPSGIASKPVATALVTTDSDPNCAAANVAAQVVGAR